MSDPTRLDPEDYLQNRVEDQLTWYEQAAGRAKKNHMRAQRAIVVLGVSLPILINLPDSGFEVVPGIDLIDIVATGLSLALAALTGLTNLHKEGDLWLSYRAAEELLKYEKFLYKTRSGHYQGQADQPAFADFVQRIESICSAEHNNFRSIIEDSKRPTAPSEKPS